MSFLWFSINVFMIYFSKSQTCSLPRDSGPCRALFIKYYYDGTQCTDFVYGGCGGNANRFDSIKECEAVCGTTTSTTIKPISTPTLIPTINPTKKPTGNPSNIPTLFPTMKPSTKPSRNPTIKPTSMPTLSPTMNPTTKPTRNPTVNPTFTPNVCSLPLDPGLCRSILPKYYYNGSDCNPFIYTGCKGNQNNFATKELCQKACGSTNVTTSYIITTSYVTTLNPSSAPSIITPIMNNTISDVNNINDGNKSLLSLTTETFIIIIASISCVFITIIVYILSYFCYYKPKKEMLPSTTTTTNTMNSDNINLTSYDNPVILGVKQTEGNTNTNTYNNKLSILPDEPLLDNAIITSGMSADELSFSDSNELIHNTEGMNTQYL